MRLHHRRHLNLSVEGSYKTNGTDDHWWDGWSQSLSRGYFKSFATRFHCLRIFLQPKKRKKTKAIKYSYWMKPSRRSRFSCWSNVAGLWRTNWHADWLVSSCLVLFVFLPRQLDNVCVCQSRMLTISGNLFVWIPPHFLYTVANKTQLPSVLSAITMQTSNPHVNPTCFVKANSECVWSFGKASFPRWEINFLLLAWFPFPSMMLFSAGVISAPHAERASTSRNAAPGSPYALSSPLSCGYQQSCVSLDVFWRCARESWDRY